MPIKGCSKTTSRNFTHILIVIQVLIGLMVILTSEYFKNQLGRYVPEIEQNEINVKLFLFELFGLHVFLSYIGGLILIRQSLQDPYTNHKSNLLKLWHFFIFTTSFNGILGSYVINGSRTFLKTTVQTSLYRGLDVYYSEPAWRLIWDAFQYNEQCCGVLDYKDWQVLSWMEYDNGSMKVESDENILSLTPYSCCKKSAGCYENAVPQKRSDIWMRMPNMNMTSINQGGCLKVFSEQLDQLCCIIFVFVGVVVLLQILIVIIMKIVFMCNRRIDTIQTNQESQTEIARGTPITFDSRESVETIDECDNENDHGITLQKKFSKCYMLKNYNQKNRVQFTDSTLINERHETQTLLGESSH